MTSQATSPHTPEEALLLKVSHRNIANSRRVILNDFEHALADIIEQLEQPESIGERELTTLDTARLIAESMCDGFAGLHPNGFEFACWLWDVAPLHVVHMPQANALAPGRGVGYGAIHLRRIASTIAGMYVAAQPLRADSVIELFDSSIDWVDARNLVSLALVDHFDRDFPENKQQLERIAAGSKTWRRVLPLGVAARIIGTRTDEAEAAFTLLRQALPFLYEESTYRAMLYVLRIAALYGDQHSIIHFLGDLRCSDDVHARRLFRECMRNPRLRWDRVSKEWVADVFRSWLANAGMDECDCINRSIEMLEL